MINWSEVAKDEGRIGRKMRSLNAADDLGVIEATRWTTRFNDHRNHAQTWTPRPQQPPVRQAGRKTAESQNQSFYCFQCGQEGHYNRNCPRCQAMAISQNHEQPPNRFSCIPSAPNRVWDYFTFLSVTYCRSYRSRLPLQWALSRETSTESSLFASATYKHADALAVYCSLVPLLTARLW